MEGNAPLGEEHVEVSVPDECDHEQEEADREEEQPGEGIGGPDEELVVRGGSEELGGGLGPVREGVDLLHVEHHQGPGRDGDERVEEADHGEERETH